MTTRPAYPDSTEPFFIPGPAGRLELMASTPEPDADCGALAVVCHPHPQHGGTMHNKVVTILERSLRELGAHVVLFNFRGVGESEGEYDQGNGETDDLMTVVQWAQQALPEHDLWLAGFSFGAWIACRGAMQTQARLLLNVAPAVNHADFDAIGDPHCPWIVIIGDADEIVPVGEVRDWAERHPAKPQLVVMEDASHFFHRRLMDLRGLVKNTVRRALGR